MTTEVISMANNQNQKKTKAGTNIQKVRQQNQQAAQGQPEYGTEFAQETDPQEIKRKNQKSQQNKQ